MRKAGSSIALGCVLALLFWPFRSWRAPVPGQVKERLAALAVPFVENRGQSDPQVAYYARTLGGVLFVTRRGEMVYSLPGQVLSEAPCVRGEIRVQGEDPSGTAVSVFVGDDPSRWKSSLSTFNQVGLGEVVPGVGLTLKAYGGRIEKLFHVRPYGDPGAIRMRMEGAPSLTVEGTGALRAGTVRFSPPRAFQDGREVEVAFVASGLDYGFRLGGYDRSLELVIDPLTEIVQSSYLGGALNDWSGVGACIAVHPATRDVYVAGYTASADFPNRAGGAQAANSGGATDAFVARFDSTLTSNIQCSYFGGTGEDQATVLAIHPTTGDVYLGGFTASTDLPNRAGGAQSAYGGGTYDGFVARFNSTLTSNIQSSYMGGSANDQGYGLVVHPSSGDLYLAGLTVSADLPSRTGGAQAAYTAANDAFVARFNSTLTSNVQSSYLGGAGDDVAYSLAAHPSSGDLYLGGYTSSANLPNRSGGAQAAHAGGTNDGFLARFNSTLTSNVQSSYLGGTGDDIGLAIAVHPASGDLYLGGYTASTDLPNRAGGAQSAYGGGTYDGFAARFNSTLTSNVQSTYLGGAARDETRALVVHPSSGDLYLGGTTASADLPNRTGGAQTAHGGGTYDAYLAQLNVTLTSNIQSTYLGGTADDLGYGLAANSTNRDLYLAGNSGSANLPGRTGGGQAANGGNTDAFAARVKGEPNPSPAAAPTGGGSSCFLTAARRRGGP